MCLLFFRDPEAKITLAHVRQVLEDRGLTVAGKDPVLAVTWGDSPTLRVAVTRGEVAKVLLARLLGKSRKHRTFASSCDAYVEITFDNLEEVLDEINTLIEVQTTLQEATAGLCYRSWNQTFSTPEELAP